MARSSAAAVAAPAPAKRRKPTGGHATTQTPRRPARRTSGPAKSRTAAQPRQGVAARKSASAATRSGAARKASAGTARSVAAPSRAPARTAPRIAPRPRTAPRTRTRTAPLVQRLAHGRTGAVADQLLRGRACVAMVFVLLVGIVFLNVSLLEMNGGIARTDAQATALENENAKLRNQLAPLASSERIQREAVERGYSLPAAGDMGFIRGSANANAKKAVERMTAPGMGEGVASRPAAQVQEERVGPPPAPTASSPETTPTPQATTPETTPAPAAQPAAPPAATPTTTTATTGP